MKWVFLLVNQIKQKIQVCRQKNLPSFIFPVWWNHKQIVIFFCGKMALSCCVLYNWLAFPSSLTSSICFCYQLTHSSKTFTNWCWTLDCCIGFWFFYWLFVQNLFCIWFHNRNCLEFARWFLHCKLDYQSSLVDISFDFNWLTSAERNEPLEKGNLIQTECKLIYLLV